MIKTQDEISLLNTACAMVDAAYDELYKAMKPGMRENEAVGARHQACSTSSARSTSRASTRSRASAAARTRTSSPTACCGRATRCTTTSSTPTWATAPATTGRSRSARASHALVDAYKRCRDYPRRGDRADPARRDDRRNRGRLAEGAGVRLPRRGSGVRAAVWATASASRSGRSRSSAASSRSTTRKRSSRAWCSRSRRSGPRPTAGPRRASKRRSSSRRRLRSHHALPGRGAAGRGRRHFTVGGPLPAMRESAVEPEQPDGIGGRASSSSARYEGAHA